MSRRSATAGTATRARSRGSIAVQSLAPRFEKGPAGAALGSSRTSRTIPMNASRKDFARSLAILRKLNLCAPVGSHASTRACLSASWRVYRLGGQRWRAGARTSARCWGVVSDQSGKRFEPVSAADPAFPSPSLASVPAGDRPAGVASPAATEPATGTRSLALTQASWTLRIATWSRTAAPRSRWPSRR
jgi:hypothetical protein